MRVTGPPTPVPMVTPRRSGSTSWWSSVGSVKPASAHACRAAMTATCSQRSSLRACTRGSRSSGSSASCAPIFTGKSYLSTQSASMVRIPLFPASRPSQVDATAPPRGVVAPIPVITTSVLLMESPKVGASGSLLEVRGNVVHCVSDGLQVGKLVVRDLHTEPVLCLDSDLHHGQRVDVQIVHEGLLGGHVVLCHTGDLFDDLGESGEDLRVFCHWLVPFSVFFVDP